MTAVVSPSIFVCVLQVFYWKDAVDCVPGTKLSGTVSLVRQEKNKRLYNMEVSILVDGEDPRRAIYEIP